jgi:biopolymer transport protein ExbD
MSHGAASDDTVEPNLTPLLDLVLQLLMFFLITVNFTQGVTNTGESLPHSETAAPLDADGGDPIVLSVKPFRIVMPEPPKDPNKGPRDDYRLFRPEARARLRERFKDRETTVFIPTEQLTEEQRSRGIGQDALVRNLFNAGERLKKMAEDERKLAVYEKENRVKNPKARVDFSTTPPTVLIPIHIRADEDVRTGDIYELMDACKEAGFVNIKARALLGSGDTKGKK